MSVTSYNYSFGKYDYDRQEMRGFGTVVENKQSGSVWHYFLQDKARKGKEYKTDVPGFLMVNNEYVGVVSDIGIYNVTLHSTSTYRYDGNESPFITNVTYGYDQFGNVLSVAELGDVNVSGDERFMNYTYAADKSDWILEKASSSRVFDNEYVKKKESKFYYDGLGLNGITRGALTKKEDWNNDGNNSFTYFDYDTFGNVVRQKDSLGNAMTISFDSSHTYPLVIVNALGHVVTDSFDPGTGNVLTETKNGITATYQYDTFGRVIKEIRPYDSSSLPTKKYNYSMDGVAPEVVKVSLKTTSNKTNDVSYYYDGYANLVQLKTDVENDQQIVKNIFYDGLGRVKAEQNPYFASSTPNLTVVSSDFNTSYNYDILDRVIGISNADGTSKNITFDRKNITDFDENKNRHRYTLDGYDRIAKVYEFYVDNVINVNDTFITSYDYDTNDNLVTITDNVGNVFSFTYDSLNRKTKMDDPDLGRWTYTYDQNGNLVFQSGGGGNLISGDGYYREYDNFGQLTKVRNGSISTSAVLEQYYYDADGQRIKIWRNDSANTTVYTPFKELMRIVNLTGSYDFTYVYDGDTQVARKNPDGSLQYDHTDHLGSVGVLTNQSGNVLENALYDPYGDLSSGGTKEVKLYTGHFSDDLTNQYYYGQRYYKPTDGQFISPDPTIQYIYGPQSLNRYSYVMNNPYKYNDPTGLWTLQIGGSVSGGLGEIYPIAGTAGIGFVISYDKEEGNLQFGGYGTAGSGIYIGAPGFGASIDTAYNPYNKFVKDVSGKAVSVGVEAPVYEGITGAVGLSFPQDNAGKVIADSDATDITASVGGGFKAAVSVYGTSTKTISTPSIRISSSTKQVANACPANKNNNNPTQNKPGKTFNTVKTTVSNVINSAINVVNSIKKIFGGKK